MACAAVPTPLDWALRLEADKGAWMEPAGRKSVVDVALQGGGVRVDEQLTRAKALDRLRLGDSIFHALTRAAAMAVLLILGGVILSLLIGALPALKAFGFN